jgi:CheY-like chemotaxis protein
MSQRRILVVDDDEPFLRVLKTSIKLLLPAYQVVTTKDGYAALAQFQQQSFDLLLTDYDMPRMNGLDLAERVRQISPDILIVLMTAGYSRDEIQTMAGSANLAGFLTKPFSLGQLREILQRNGI